MNLLLLHRIIEIGINPQQSKYFDGGICSILNLVIMPRLISTLAQRVVLFEFAQAVFSFENKVSY